MFTYLLTIIILTTKIKRILLLHLPVRFSHDSVRLPIILFHSNFQTRPEKHIYFSTSEDLYNKLLCSAPHSCVVGSQRCQVLRKNCQDRHHTVIIATSTLLHVTQFTGHKFVLSCKLSSPSGATTPTRPGSGAELPRSPFLDLPYSVLL